MMLLMTVVEVVVMMMSRCVCVLLGWNQEP